jgi:predicted nucleotidyltransferase
MDTELQKKLQLFFTKVDFVKFGYLFGSYANSTFHNNSDIDIAIFYDENSNNFEKELEVHHLLQKEFKKDIDLVNLNNIKNIFLLENILKNGILIKDTNDETRKMFEVYKYHQIIDFKEYRKMQDVA